MTQLLHFLHLVVICFICYYLHTIMERLHNLNLIPIVFKVRYIYCFVKPMFLGLRATCICLFFWTIVSQKIIPHLLWYVPNVSTKSTILTTSASARWTILSKDDTTFDVEVTGNGVFITSFSSFICCFI